MLEKVVVKYFLSYLSGSMKRKKNVTVFYITKPFKFRHVVLFAIFSDLSTAGDER